MKMEFVFFMLPEIMASTAVVIVFFFRDAEYKSFLNDALWLSLTGFGVWGFCRFVAGIG
jgi:hypothetical protein